MTQKLSNDELLKELVALGEEGLAMHHYQLANHPNTSEDRPEVWKQFLLHPKTASYIEEEMKLIRSGQVNKMMMSASDTKNVGQSNLLNSIINYDKDHQRKEGPAFVFMHVPLNENQKKAPEAKRIDEFLKGGMF